MPSTTTPPPRNRPVAEGVGARPRETAPPHPQGGYLDNCTGSERAFSSPAATGASDNLIDNVYTERPDLVQDDLFWCEVGPSILSEHAVPLYRGCNTPEIPAQFRDVSLAPFWQRIAAHLGPVAFLELLSVTWQYAPIDGERQRVDIPSRESMRKLWRNGLIRQCAAQGLDTNQTMRSLQAQGLTVSPTTISRVLRYIPFDD